MIELQHISYRYPSGKMALDDVSLTINSGERIALMGANGSGKSSLFLMLAGVVKPNAGQYLFNGSAFRYCRKLRKELCKNIGFVFQDPDVQVVANDVFEDVAFGLRNLGLGKDEVACRAEKYMKLTGISELRDKTIHSLSYGQKKQVALAGVLAMEPDIIMLDEPFAWLDYRQSERLKSLLDKLAEMEKTLIISTHDSDFAYQWAQRVLVMKDGILKANAEVNEVFGTSSLTEEFDIAPLRTIENRVIL